jgi:hypothetical protein
MAFLLGLVAHWMNPGTGLLRGKLTTPDTLIPLCHGQDKAVEHGRNRPGAGKCV